jgi:hypothetical protein
MGRLRMFAAVLAFGAILGQAGIALAFPALSLGVDARDDDGTYVVICTGHGIETIRLKDGEAVPVERSAPTDVATSCPLCLSATDGPFTALAPANVLSLTFRTTFAAPARASDVPVDLTTVVRYGRAPPLQA